MAALIKPMRYISCSAFVSSVMFSLCLYTLLGSKCSKQLLSSQSHPCLNFVFIFFISSSSSPTVFSSSFSSSSSSSLSASLLLLFCFRNLFFDFFVGVYSPSVAVTVSKSLRKFRGHSESMSTSSVDSGGSVSSRKLEYSSYLV
uniref:Uncharacterized protein n=2 Tax=Cacopsylla melanoneura TaxID=428564 RepID=A0A8D9A0L8_9HEMI